MKRWLVGIVALTAVLLAAAWGLRYFALDPDCGNSVIKETTSPDGKYVAVVFDRDCGATTGSERIVMLRSREHKFAPDDYHGWIFTSDREPRVEVNWSDSTHIIVRSDGSDQSLKAAESWRDVKIVRDQITR